ncbi:MAG: hypothetical protein LH660_13645, partial [Phormidesmis sp. CAN_BIN36]|nr:hypothetical protein [Phormidesmis sp. CAN_BIN36]
ILAPFSLGRRAGEGFAPLREEGVFILRFSNAADTPSLLRSISRRRTLLRNPSRLIDYLGSQ